MKTFTVDGQNVVPDVHDVLERMRDFSARIRSGEFKVRFCSHPQLLDDSETRHNAASLEYFRKRRIEQLNAVVCYSLELRALHRVPQGKRSKM